MSSCGQCGAIAIDASLSVCWSCGARMSLAPQGARPSAAPPAQPYPQRPSQYPPNQPYPQAQQHAQYAPGQAFPHPQGQPAQPYPQAPQYPQYPQGQHYPQGQQRPRGSQYPQGQHYPQAPQYPQGQHYPQAPQYPQHYPQAPQYPQQAQYPQYPQGQGYPQQASSPQAPVARAPEVRSARQQAIRSTTTSAFLESYSKAISETGGDLDGTLANLNRTVVSAPIFEDAEAIEALRAPEREAGSKVPALPASTARLSTMGAGPALVAANLLVSIDSGADARAIATKALKVTASRVRADEAEAIHMRRAEMLSDAGELAEADLRSIRVTAASRPEDRARAARLFVTLARSAWQKNKVASARWASARALEVSNDGAAIRTKTRTREERLAAELAIGRYEEATHLASALARENPDDLDVLQRCAAALVKSAVMWERDPRGERSSYWSPAIALWATLISHPPFWRAFARRRGAVYGKEADEEQISEATNNVRDRLLKMLGALTEAHKEAGARDDAAELTRFGEAFMTELDAIGALKELGAGLRARSIDLPGPKLPLGPLGMQLFGVREKIAAVLAPLSTPNPRSPFDIAVAKLVRDLGELAEGWALLAQSKYAEAVEFARERLRARRADEEAQRLLVSTLETAVKARLGNAEAIEECLGWFAAIALPQASVMHLGNAFRNLGDLRGPAHAKKLLKEKFGALDKKIQNHLLAGLHTQEAAEFGPRKEWGRGLPLLIDAALLDPDDDDIGRMLDVFANNHAIDLLTNSNGLTARAQWDKLAGKDLKPMRAARVIILRRCAIEAQDQSRFDEAERIARDAIRVCPPRCEHEDSLRIVLSNILVQQAVSLVKIGARAASIDKLREASKLGHPQATELLGKIDINPWARR